MVGVGGKKIGHLLWASKMDNPLMEMISLSGGLDILFKIHAFFYKQHFYKQRQAEIGKESNKS